MATPLLLDTCTFIWLTQDPGKLSAASTSAINDPDNSVILSHVSAWEIHLKHQTGKLQLPESPRQWIPEQLAWWNIKLAEITLNAIQRTSDLPDIHRDPFDRLLIAQALEERWSIVSPDPFFPGYGVALVW
jgi:PIN domain nuclease of toxin-antitoxin system